MIRLFSSEKFETPCRIEIEQSAEHFHAHVELDGDVELGPGDQVKVHGDAVKLPFGERLTLRVEAGSATPVTVVGGAPAAVAVPATTALALPLPRHGDAARAWSPTALAAALALAGLATAVVGIAARWPKRTRRAHRGRALAAALRAGDHTAAARAASALRADLPPHLIAVADAFDAELAAIRFGGASAERLAGLAAQLETLP